MRRGFAARRGALVIWTLCSWMAFGASVADAREVPFLSGRVVDEANLLPPDAEERLTQRLANLEQRTGAQLAVLTIPSLEGDAVEEFAVRVATTWALGGAANDNGVLFLIAQNDRRMRIEVGYGLEGEIPDIIAGRILNEVVTPRFRDGDFVGGIEQGVDAISGFITGEGVLPERREPSGIPFDVILFILLIFFFFVLPRLQAARHYDDSRRGRHRRRGGPSVILLPGGFGGGGGRRGGGGFGGGGFGGFSGGGGSFGGGGASGSW